jgi:hypothetical protein
MIVGQYYRRNGGGTQHRPTSPRGGLGSVPICEVFDNDRGVTMSIRVERKNTEDVAFVLLGTLAAMPVGLSTTSLTGVKEEVRFGFVIDGVNPEDSVYANVLPPNWQPY